MSRKTFLCKNTCNVYLSLQIMNKKRITLIDKEQRDHYADYINIKEKLGKVKFFTFYLCSF